MLLTELGCNSGFFYCIFVREQIANPWYVFGLGISDLVLRSGRNHLEEGSRKTGVEKMYETG